MTDKEFAGIINSTKKVVLSAIGKNLSSRFYHAIDDIVQETYMRAFKSLKENKFRGDSSINTWLYTIARNESLRMGKKLKREEEKFKKSMEKLDYSLKTDEEDNSIEIEILHERINLMPKIYRDVMELLSGGFNEKQIAEKLEIKRGTVKSRISRGKEILVKLYSENNRYSEEEK